MPSFPARRPRIPRLAAASALALAAVLAWDLGGLDLPLARLAGSPQGFPLQHHWLLTRVLHDGARHLAWGLVAGLGLAAAWPIGPLRALPPRRRVQLAASALLASAFVTALKATSHTSCPWDLREFGGIATHVSHWTGWGLADGGAGRCFPAGHASTGFAFAGGYFALRDELPALARRWLACALGAGLVLGIVQQLRGAHFMSHTLWSGWLCWMAAWVTDPLFSARGGTPTGLTP